MSTQPAVSTPRASVGASRRSVCARAAVMAGLVLLATAVCDAQNYQRTRQVMLKPQHASVDKAAGIGFGHITEPTELRLEVSAENASIQDMGVLRSEGAIWSQDPSNAPGKEPWIWILPPSQDYANTWVLLYASVKQEQAPGGPSGPGGPGGGPGGPGVETEKRYVGVCAIDVDVDSDNIPDLDGDGHRIPDDETQGGSNDDLVEWHGTTNGSIDPSRLRIGMVFGVNDDHETSVGGGVVWYRDCQHGSVRLWDLLQRDTTLPRIRLQGSFPARGQAIISALPQDRTTRVRIFRQSGATGTGSQVHQWQFPSPQIPPVGAGVWGWQQGLYLEVAPLLREGEERALDFYLEALYDPFVTDKNNMSEDRALCTALRMDIDVDSDNDGAISDKEEADSDGGAAKFEDYNESRDVDAAGEALPGLVLPLDGDRRDGVLRRVQLDANHASLLDAEGVRFRLTKLAGGGSVQTYRLNPGGQWVPWEQWKGFKDDGDSVYSVGGTALMAVLRTGDFPFKLHGTGRGTVYLALEAVLRQSKGGKTVYHLLHRDVVKMTIR